MTKKIIYVFLILFFYANFGYALSKENFKKMLIESNATSQQLLEADQKTVNEFWDNCKDSDLMLRVLKKSNNPKYPYINCDIMEKCLNDVSAGKNDDVLEGINSIKLMRQYLDGTINAEELEAAYKDIGRYIIAPKSSEIGYAYLAILSIYINATCLESFCWHVKMAYEKHGQHLAVAGKNRDLDVHKWDADYTAGGVEAKANCEAQKLTNIKKNVPQIDKEKNK